MNRENSARAAATLAAVLLASSACAGGSPSGGGQGGPAKAAPATAAPAATTGSSPRPGQVDEMLVLRMAKATPEAAFAVLDPGQGRVMISIPDGVVSRDWQTHVSLSVDGGSTEVRVRAPESGDPPTRIAVPGAWRLPAIGVARNPAGLSGDGGTLVLEEAAGAAPPASTGTTRFAIVPTRGTGEPRIIELDGSFVFDALSPAGNWLYLLEYPTGDATHYQVRRLDVATGRLADGVIVDKRNIDEKMSGEALTQEVGRGGWVFTLFRGAHGAFVHALETTEGIAFCIDLPGTVAGDSARDGSWGLAADPAGDWLYVADPVRRSVSAISLADFSIPRTTGLARVPSVVLAKLETAQPAGGRVTLDLGGRSLYVIDTTGVSVVRVPDLATTGHIGGSAVLRSIAIGATGTLYGVDTAGSLVRLAPGSTGPTPIGSGAYSSIVAVVPLR